ncbi:unnamed protein product, partial [Ixodes hexagonus]
MHQNHPELLKDQYWNDVMPPELPYTLASKQFYCFPHQGSTACMIIPPNKASFVSRDKLPTNSPLRGPKNEEEIFHLSDLSLAETKTHTPTVSEKREPKEPDGTTAKEDILSSSVEDDPSTVVYVDG